MIPWCTKSETCHISEALDQRFEDAAAKSDVFIATGLVTVWK
jgi:hypothetical protein